MIIILKGTPVWKKKVLQPLLSSQNLQPYCISEMQTLWGESEQVVTKKKNGDHFNMLNSTELLTRGDN